MRHAKDLQKWLLDHPDDTRSQFYLGQSFRDAGPEHWDKAFKAYERRIEMGGGWEEEMFHSALQMARMTLERGQDPTSAYVRAYEMRPHRAEPLTELANWLRHDKQKRYSLAAIFARRAAALPMPNDGLFVNAEHYQWQALEALAVSLSWLPDPKGALECWVQLEKRAPDWAKPHMIASAEFERKRITEGVGR